MSKANPLSAVAVDTLVSRLRLQPGDIGGPSRLEMLRERAEAANEIEQQAKVIRELQFQYQLLQAENEKLKAGLLDVQGLIESSDGVYGLHLNGAPSFWDELLAGGRFENWLINFSTALQNLGDE